LLESGRCKSTTNMSCGPFVRLPDVLPYTTSDSAVAISSFQSKVTNLSSSCPDKLCTLCIPQNGVIGMRARVTPSTVPASEWLADEWMHEYHCDYFWLLFRVPHHWTSAVRSCFIHILVVIEIFDIELKSSLVLSCGLVSIPFDLPSSPWALLHYRLVFSLQSNNAHLIKWSQLQRSNSPR